MSPVKVLIALDDAAVSSRAARAAVRLFDGQADTEFLVINVSNLPTAWVGNTAYGAVGRLMVDPRWLEPGNDNDELQERLLIAHAAAAGVPDPEVIVRPGDAVHQICTAAAEHDVDVIVVGSHDKSALRRLFDPSVAAGVVRDTYLPVLIVSGTPPEAA